LKKISCSEEDTLNDLGEKFFVVYDHALKKFYVLLRNEESVFAVIEDLKYLLPSSTKSAPSQSASSFVSFSQLCLSELNFVNSRRFHMPRKWSKWSTSLE